MAILDKTEKYVVGIGEALIDCFPDGTRRLGGAPLIFAYHAGKTYGHGVIVSAVGDDDIGNTIREDIIDLGVSTDYLYTNKGMVSGTVEVNDSNPNDPQYSIQTNTAWSHIHDNKGNLEYLAKRTAAVYFGVLASYCGETSKNTIDKFLDAVPDDCWKIFDVNLRHNPVENGKYTKALYNEEIIKKYVEKCDILKVNKEEFDYVCGIYGVSGELSNKKKAETIMLQHPNIEILMLTLGEEGSYVFWKNENDSSINSQIYGLSVEDPLAVGAGDALAGAFIGEILKKEGEPIDVAYAHREAVLRAAKVCEAQNSMPPIKKSDVFVSYSWKDEDLVVHFCKLFNAKKITVWRDKEKILYGERFDKKIQDAIRNCKVVVFFSSNCANLSQYVAQEIEFANNEHKTIITIKLDDSDFNNKFKELLEYKNSLDLNVLYTTIKKNKSE